MTYPPDYRYLSTSDKHYVKNYGCTCIGAIVVVIFLAVFSSLPTMLDGTSYFAGGPLGLAFSVSLWIAPWIILGVFIKMVSNYRERKQREAMLAEE